MGKIQNAIPREIMHKRKVEKRNGRLGLPQSSVWSEKCKSHVPNKLQHKELIPNNPKDNEKD